MKSIATPIFALAAVLWFLLTGCAPRDETVNIESEDPEMVAAIAKARETLPQFWEALERKAVDESGFCLKVMVAHKTGAEHLWATDIERRGGKITGTVNNDPNIVTSVKLGDRIEITVAQISDWMYLRDGKIVGNVRVESLTVTSMVGQFSQGVRISKPAGSVSNVSAATADPMVGW